MPSWNHGAERNSGSSRMLLESLIKLDMSAGGGVVAELLVLASPELNPDEPLRLLLQPGLTMRSVEQSNVCLIESTFQFPGLL